MNTKYIKCYPCGLNDNPWLGDKGTCQGWDQNTKKFRDANKDDYIICSDVGEASYNDLRGPEKLSDNYVSRGCGTQDIVNTNTSLLQRLITPKKGSKLQKHLRVKDRNKEKRKRVAGRIKHHWKHGGRMAFIGSISFVVALIILILIGKTFGWYGKIAELFELIKNTQFFPSFGGGDGDGSGDVVTAAANPVFVGARAVGAPG